MAAPLVAILLGLAGDIVAPMVKKILAEKIGGAGGELAGSVIDTIAGKLGVPAEEIPTVAAEEPERFEQAVVATEAETPELIAAEIERMNAAYAFLQNKATPKWVPAWQWFLMFLWGFSWVMLPIVNALTGATIEKPSIPDLIWLTTCYQVLNMGGNTALRLADKAKELWGAKQ